MAITENEYQPWNQYPDESAEAFRAFGAYKRLPIDRRTLPNAWATMKPDDTEKVDSRMSTWMNRFHWEERAAAWDNHLEKIGDKTVENVVRREKLTERMRRRSTIAQLAFYVHRVGEQMRDKALANTLNPADVKTFAQTVQIYAEQSRKEYHDTDINDGAGSDTGFDHADAKESSGVRATIQQILSQDADSGKAGGVSKLTH